MQHLSLKALMHSLMQMASAAAKPPWLKKYWKNDRDELTHVLMNGGKLHVKDIDEFLAGTAEAVGVSRESASQWIREQEELSRTVINSSIHRQAIEYVMARAKINVLD